MSARSKRGRARVIELIVVVVLAILVYLVAAQYDILEWTVALSQRRPGSQLDELLIVFVFLAVAMSILALLWWREARDAEGKLRKRFDDLAKASAEIRQLRGIIPICACCKKIRDDEGAWHQVEVYVRDHSEAQFSHGFCPECMEGYLADLGEEDTPTEGGAL